MSQDTGKLRSLWEKLKPRLFCSKSKLLVGDNGYEDTIKYALGVEEYLWANRGISPEIIDDKLAMEIKAYRIIKEIATLIMPKLRSLNNNLQLMLQDIPSNYDDVEEIIVEDHFNFMGDHNTSLKVKDIWNYFKAHIQSKLTEYNAIIEEYENLLENTTLWNPSLEMWFEIRKDLNLFISEISKMLYEVNNFKNMMQERTQYEREVSNTQLKQKDIIKEIDSKEISKKTCDCLHKLFLDVSEPALYGNEDVICNVKHWSTYTFIQNIIVKNRRNIYQLSSDLLKDTSLFVSQFLFWLWRNNVDNFPINGLIEIQSTEKILKSKARASTFSQFYRKIPKM